MALMPVAPLLAQLANNTVTVKASQTSTAQPDEAVFSVTVASGVDATLDQIVSAVSGLGITAANLVSVNTSPVIGGALTGTPPLMWNFQHRPLFQTERHHRGADRVTEVHLAKYQRADPVFHVVRN